MTASSPWRKEHAYLIGCKAGRLLTNIRLSRRVIRAETGEALSRAGEIVKRKTALRKAVVNAVTYPSIIMLALGVTFYQISVTVMPKLLRVTKKEYWDSSTYAMQYMSDFVAAHGGKLVMGCVGLILFAIVSMPRLTGRVRFYLDKIPPLTVYRIVQGAIFLYNVCVLLEAGVSKVEILDDMSKRASPYMRERIDGVLAGVKNGLDLGSALMNVGTTSRAGIRSRT